MVKFGMTSTLLTFVDKYYEYDRNQDPEDKGLTIGGCKSAWLADLTGACILENTQLLFKHTRYHGICRDDGFGVLIGKWTCQEVVSWRKRFQKQVNILVEGDYLQFTCEVWLDSTVRASSELSQEVMKKNKVAIQNSKTFLCLDMEFFGQQMVNCNSKCT
jgi:hypothetical protein